MPEPSLRQLQQWMKAHVRPAPPARRSRESPAPALAPGGPGGRAAVVTGEPGSDAGVQPSEADRVLLNPQRGTPGIERLAVYAGGYVARTHEALNDVYPAVRHVTGADAFLQLAQAYAGRYPSHDYNLNFMGRNVPEFLTSWPLTERLPFLPDLARLEWAICAAFHAFDEPPLDAARLERIPPEQWDRLRLIPQPSVALVASAWPIRDIWAARTQPRGTVDIDVDRRPQRILVFRRELQVTCDLLEEVPYHLLEGLVQGRSLGEVCQAMANGDGHDVARVTNWFIRWSQQGLFKDFQLYSA